MNSPKCDICGSFDLSLIDITNDSLNPNIHFKTYRCRHCGLFFVLPQPTNEELNEYYSLNYQGFNLGIDMETNPLMRFARYQKLLKKANIIKKYSHKKIGDILDVGCGMGHFLYVMRKTGWNVRGIEPSIEAANYARSHYSLAIDTGTSRSIELNSSQFDVITYWDVLEHTYSPSSEIAFAYEHLKPDGLIFLNIPNWNSFDRLLFKNLWIGFNPPEHLFVFNLNNISHLLEKNGFRVIDSKCITTSFFAFAIELNRWLSIKNSHIASKVKAILEIPGVRYLFEPILTPLSWCKLGSTITIIARRKNP